MLKDRKKWLKEFDKAVANRNAPAIHRMEIVIYRKFWLQTFKEKASEELGFPVDFRNPKAKKIAENLWKQLIKNARNWQKNNKATTWKITSVREQRGGKEIKIRVSSKIKIAAGATPKKSIGGRGTKGWYKNALASMKRYLFNPGGYKVVLEHGLVAEHLRIRTQPYKGAGIPIEYIEHQEGRFKGPKKTKYPIPGDKGSNLDTSIMQALSNTHGAHHQFTGWIVDRVAQFIQLKYDTTLKKSYSRSAMIRRHVIHIIAMPDDKAVNRGDMDRRDIANFRKYIESGTQAELAKYVRRKLKPNSPLRKNPAFDNMIAGSPDFIDDLDSMSEDMWNDEVERADREMRRSNAQMTMFKNKIKKPKKQKKSIRLGQTQQRGSVKSNSPIIVDRIASHNPRGSKAGGAKALNKISPNQRTAEMRNRGTVGNIAIKDLLNRILQRDIPRRMHTPALNYRTGEFARSVEVQNVFEGPRGGVYIDYAYNQEPYGVFELGQGVRPWATAARDPKRLIGQTIRDILRVNRKGLGKDVSTTAVLTRNFK